MVLGLKKRRGVLLEKKVSLRLIELDAHLKKLEKDVTAFHKGIKSTKDYYSKNITDKFLKMSNDTLEIREELEELTKVANEKELIGLKKRAQKLLLFKKPKISLENYCKRIK